MLNSPVEDGSIQGETTLLLSDDEETAVRELLFETPAATPWFVPRPIYHWYIGMSAVNQARLRNTIEVVVLVAFSMLFSWVFIFPYCGLLFRCGCTWLWAGGIDSCNIFDKDTPNCPFCTAKPTFLQLVPQWGGAVFMIFGTTLFSLKVTNYFVRPFIAIFLWFIFETLLAIIYKVAYDYPYFLGLRS